MATSWSTVSRCKRSQRPSPSPLKFILLISLSAAVALPFSFTSFSYGRHSPNLSSVGSIPSAVAEPPPQPPLSPPAPRSSVIMNSSRLSNPLPPLLPSPDSPYHDWDLFRTDFEDMLRTLRIFVYPDVRNTTSPFASAFLPHPNPSGDPKLGNYFSEHMFKSALLYSTLLTSDPNEALFFFLPFSVNALRNDRRVWSEDSIASFVAAYTERIGREFGFWNASGGSDHFYVCCHSVGRDAASKHPGLRDRAIQVACSSSYFQRLYFAHKDVGLPQVWPRSTENAPNPPHARNRLVFFSGRIQNSRVRRDLITLWGNDTSMDIFSGNPPFPYEEGFRKSKYCLHVKGYEVNTARISDAIHYGCIPVIVSNHYDLPFASVLDWSKFSIVVDYTDVAMLKRILVSIPKAMYLTMYRNLLQVRKHFRWQMIPRGYDSFHMTTYQLWLRRGVGVHRSSRL